MNVNIYVQAALNAVKSILMFSGYIYCILYWPIFKKAGEKGWKSLVPGYGYYTLCKLVWKKDAFWTWLTCILASVMLTAIGEEGDVAGTIFSGSGIMALINETSMAAILVMLSGGMAMIIRAITAYKLSCAFGHGILFFLGLLLFPPLFLLILDFGSSQYMADYEYGENNF